MPNDNLSKAKSSKNDEFYTQYEDIQREVNAYLDFDPDTFRGKTVLLPCDDPEWSNFTRFFAQNFELLGLKKLISTSYAPDSKPADIPYQLTFFETSSPEYDTIKTHANGKIFTLTPDTAKKVNLNDLKWSYLKGDGDFRSDEVKALRDEADIIVTNPPFSLFREFVAWVVEKQKKFLIIGNQNAITYKEIFPLLKDNKVWFGYKSGDMAFVVPDSYEPRPTRYWQDETGLKWRSLGNICWFTNLDHGRRHQPLSLMTMADNIKFSKHKEIRGHEYQKYDNYDAIDVPFVDAIPSDYNGVMGVPVTFLDKYCLEQFEIMDANELRKYPSVPIKPHGLVKDKEGSYTDVDGNEHITYARILIKRKNNNAD